MRTHVEGVVTTGNDRFPVDGGEVSFTAVPGPAVLALISQGRAVDTIPILVGDAATQTLRQVVSAAKVADDATQREIEKLAAQAVELVDSSVENAKKAQDGATRAETAAGNAKTSETNAASSSSGAKSSASAASSSASKAATSEKNAAKSASAAATSASSAKADADRAANIASSTSWNGDKLTVNGQTSPSLRGPKGDSGASAWDDITGKPSTFPPRSHTHRKADITDLPSFAEGIVEGSVPRRGSDGTFFVREPQKEGHVATKSYVDTAIAAEKARTVGMVWMVETEDQAKAKETSCQKGDFIQVAATGTAYQVTNAGLKLVSTPTSTAGFTTETSSGSWAKWTGKTPAWAEIGSSFLILTPGRYRVECPSRIVPYKMGPMESLPNVEKDGIVEADRTIQIYCPSRADSVGTIFVTRLA
ncbi:hypothetical protein RAE03_10690 [Corynebacterium tuberculostearicum]|uniref:Uncharacterized protein n=1 Tax=Corynebacterium tuberculostearicum TaxID=38304 RepID=A0AAE4SZI2_9CORY|nr:hypothetical protein [Corynebacterium tuberculostearicum]MDV2420230.1 hypothetical protein [Corynebacterium tuberculostearicum]